MPVVVVCVSGHMLKSVVLKFFLICHEASHIIDGLVFLWLMAFWKQKSFISTVDAKVMLHL